MNFPPKFLCACSLRAIQYFFFFLSFYFTLLQILTRNFDVVASGTLDGVTRVYMHRRVSNGCYLLAEIVMSVGHDTNAPCTLTTTIKVDEYAMGNPNLGRFVDSLELGILFRY